MSFTVVKAVKPLSVLHGLVFKIKIIHANYIKTVLTVTDRVRSAVYITMFMQPITASELLLGKQARNIYYKYILQTGKYLN